MLSQYNILLVIFQIWFNKIWAQIQLVGDIYQDSWDLTVYYNPLEVEHKCIKELPAVFFQSIENEPVAGNGSSEFFHRLEICCEGYKRSAYNWHTCIPDCSKSSVDNCHNGFCRSPNMCECFEGFIKNPEGKCIHTCPITCENGKCLLTGACMCNPGYVLDVETRKFCVPDCSNIACGLNQRCVAPGKCDCAERYKYIENLGCQPLCSPDCGHGRCVAPNECECFAGYKKRPGRQVCEADCLIDCDIGFCETRYSCRCPVGFFYDESIKSCLPSCNNTCQHGVCIAPGICQCFEGYYLVDNTCAPICESGCGLYGTCVAPNKCACGAGQQLCLAGYCNALGKCACSTGKSHFIDECRDTSDISNIVFNYDQAKYYNEQMKKEYHALIGRMFQF